MFCPKSDRGNETHSFELSCNEAPNWSQTFAECSGVTRLAGRGSSRAGILKFSRPLQLMAEDACTLACSTCAVRREVTTTCCQLPKLRGHLASVGSCTQPEASAGSGPLTKRESAACLSARPSMDSTGIECCLWRSKLWLRRAAARRAWRAFVVGRSRERGDVLLGRQSDG